MPHDEYYDRLRRADINSPSPDVRNEEIPGFGDIIDAAQRGDRAAQHTVHDVVETWPQRPRYQPPFDPGEPGGTAG